MDILFPILMMAISFAIGFVAGMEYLKHRIAYKIKKAFEELAKIESEK